MCPSAPVVPLPSRLQQTSDMQGRAVFVEFFLPHRHP